MTESMPSSIQPNQPAQKPTIWRRLSGVRMGMDGIAGAMLRPGLRAILIFSVTFCPLAIGNFSHPRKCVQDIFGENTHWLVSGTVVNSVGSRLNHFRLSWIEPRGSLSRVAQ